MKPDVNAVPRLAPGVRLGDNDREAKVLLMPERALRLNGPSFEILRLCNGQRSIMGIAEELGAAYPAADPQRILADTIEYLAALRDQRAIDF